METVEKSPLPTADVSRNWERYKKKWKLSEQFNLRASSTLCYMEAQRWMMAERFNLLWLSPVLKNPENVIFCPSIWNTFRIDYFFIHRIGFSYLTFCYIFGCHSSLVYESGTFRVSNVRFWRIRSDFEHLFRDGMGIYFENILCVLHLKRTINHAVCIHEP